MWDCWWGCEVVWGVVVVESSSSPQMSSVVESEWWLGW